jgi:hypothetical protein
MMFIIYYCCLEVSVICCGYLEVVVAAFIYCFLLCLLSAEIVYCYDSLLL